MPAAIAHARAIPDFETTSTCAPSVRTVDVDEVLPPRKRAGSDEAATRHLLSTLVPDQHQAEETEVES